MEQKLLAGSISSRDTFEKLIKYDAREFLSEPGKLVFDFIKEYYDNDPEVKKADVEFLKNKVARKFPKQKEIFNHVFGKLQEFDETTSFGNELKEILELKKDSVKEELRSTLAAGNDTHAITLMEQYQELAEQKPDSDNEQDSTLLISPKLDDILEPLEAGHRIRLWPKSLNDYTYGGAVRGNNILVYARSEVGKSLFTINMVGGFLHDGYKVLFLENEDPTAVTMQRIMSRITERSLTQMLSDKESSQELLDKSNFKNLVFKSLSPGTYREIRQLVKEYKPDIVVINQLRNLYVGRHDRVNQLELAATESRNLAKENNLVVINVTQAGDSATNKLVLEQGDVDFSNTGIPSQMDLMIGIGMNSDYEQQGRRMISLPKNKLGGDHSFFPVAFDTKINKVSSV